MTSQTSAQAPAGRNLVVRWWPIAKISRYQRNPRICPQEAIEAVAASIRDFGWKVPLVVNRKGRIITGHTRYEAALSLGLAEVPVIVADDLTKAQQRAYRIADNKLAEATSWDEALLVEELATLIAMEIDPALTGFSAEELSALLAPPPTAGLCDPDELVEPPVEPISEPGDLWLLGSHRLLCGDSTKVADVERLMAGERACLMPTDGPYGVFYDGGNHPQTWAADGRKISSEDKTKHWDDYREAGTLLTFYEQFLKVALQCALSEAPIVYQWFAMTKIETVMAAWRANGLLCHQVIIWHKSRSVLGRSDFMYDYEPAMYGWLQGKRPEPERRPPANASAVWEIGSAIEDGATGIHPTQKVCELIRRPLEWHTRPGGLIYEPFAGSGTALIAAEMTGRRCSAMELSPAFCDAAVLRWQRFTGKTAIRECAS